MLRTFENFLREMALKNFKYNWVDDKQSSHYGMFDAKDKKVISHPKTAMTCERILAKIGYDFNILMIEYDTGGGTQSFPRLISNFCQANNIPIEGHITFVKNGTSGEPMTPWMILHTLGHALMAAAPTIDQKIKGLLVSFYNHYVNNNDLAYYRPDTVKTLSRFFQFKSAIRKADGKKLGVSDIGEIVHELVAEYLWHGGNIRWKFPTEPFKPPEDNDEISLENSNNQYLQKQYLERIIEQIKGLIDNALSSQVGKIIYDII